MSNYSQAWEQSYKNRDNHIFYPKEEVVRFVSRFVRKKVGLSEFKDVLDFTQRVRGLDYGCGIGRHTILLQEFGIEAYGIDISLVAIETARQLALSHGFPELSSRLQVSDGHSVAFADDYFDVTVCEAVLDSMTFDLACKDLAEIARVTKKYIFISLIFGPQAAEEIVQTAHEKGTIQCYYNEEKIQHLLQGLPLEIKHWYLQKEISIKAACEEGRYYLVLEKKEHVA